MEDLRSRAGDEFEKSVAHAQRRWEWVVIVLAVAYFVAMLAPWVWHGCPVVRQ